MRAVLVQAVSLGLLVVLAASFVSLQRTATVEIDGQVTELRTFARTVGETLDRSGITVGERDLLIPERDAPLASGQKIIVKTARPLLLDLDDRGAQVVWTTATSVDEALSSFGVRADGSFVSVSRSSAIPRTGLSVQVRTPRTVNLLADGERREVVTTAATYRDVLTESGVTMAKADLVSVNLDDVPTDGAVMTITRVSGKTTVKSVPVKFKTVERKDPNRFKGTRVTVQEGRPGVLVKKYRIRLLDGKRSGTRLVEERYKVKPVTRIIAVGTKAVPKAPRDVADLNWKALAQCESGGRATVVSSNGLYYGLYQFLPSTWRAVGGTGLPNQASPAEQTFRAQKLYQVANWRTQWPVCGVKLFS
jgi:uncharacterized protein YabE (DUF348 family)